MTDDDNNNDNDNDDDDDDDNDNDSNDNHKKSLRKYFILKYCKPIIIHVH